MNYRNWGSLEAYFLRVRNLSSLFHPGHPSDRTDLISLFLLALRSSVWVLARVQNTGSLVVTSPLARIREDFYKHQRLCHSCVIHKHTTSLLKSIILTAVGWKKASSLCSTLLIMLGKNRNLLQIYLMTVLTTCSGYEVIFNSRLISTNKNSINYC